VTEPEKEWILSDILNVTVDFLAKKNPDSSPRLDAELLLARVLGLPRVSLYINFEKPLTPKQVDAYRELVRRRGRHEPAAYILGEKEFYGISFKTDKRALIPRPETEHLVDEALAILKTLPDGAPAVCDVGCGSGAVALSLAAHFPNAVIEASDASLEALALAEENARLLKLQDKVSFHEGDLLDAPFESPAFDLVCANLPYIPSGDLEKLPPDVFAFEPLSALDGGPDGMRLTSRLLQQAGEKLRPKGAILLEIDPSQYAPLRDVAEKAGLEPLEAVKDFSKKDRVLVAVKKA
jgi:release factor glutamine methyltransferase